MRNKQARQTRIRELLFERVIDTHENLAAVLHELNIEVSQSTLSKDLRELGVVRVPQADGGFRYTLPDSKATLRDRHILERELQDYLIQAEQAANMVVVKTVSGTRRAYVSRLIGLDGMKWLGLSQERTRYLSLLTRTKVPQIYWLIYPRSAETRRAM